MRNYKIILISFVLLIFLIGAVSAASNENTTVGDLPIVIDDDPIVIDDDPIVLDDDIEPLEGSTKEIYVNDTGDDSNNGSSESPYASIKKAISGVNAADNATIYLSEGTFYINESSTRYFDEEDYYDINALDFDFNHKTYGGSIVIIGAGADKTFVDGLSTYYFADIGQNANITLKDITFTNFKNTNGGTIVCRGNLTVDNCIFNNSYASGQRGGVIYGQGSGFWNYNMITGEEYFVGNTPYITVLNSQFISSFVNSYNNMQAGGGAIYVTMSYLYLENNTFVNTTFSSRGGAGAAICSSEDESTVYIINNKFINLTGTYDASIFLMYGGEVIGNEFINCSNPSETYSIVFLNQKCVFEKNIFTNSSNSVGNVYAQNAQMDGLVFDMGNPVINFGNSELNNGAPVQVNITDDMGNIIRFTNFNIRLTGENNKTYSAGINFNTMMMRIGDVPENGIYNLTFVYNWGYNPDTDSYEYLKSTDVLATVNVNASNDPVDLYVSPSGSDANNGTEEYPFETIQHAIDTGFEKSFTVIVHLLEGTYSGQGNVELNIANKGSLQIIGEKYGEVIIDGNNTSWFVSVSSTEVGIDNLTFINGYSRSKNLITGGALKGCIVANCSVINYNIIQDSTLDDLTYTDNQGRVRTSTITNSFFANNSYMNYNNGGIIEIRGSKAIIENSTFINNTATMGGVIYSVSYGFTSRNNYYANNKAPDDYRLTSDRTANYGVIFVGPNIYVFENDTFENNHAYCSGVIGHELYGFSDNVAAEYNFTGCKFINNSAVEGGVARLKAGSFTNCEFINNTADNGGVFSLVPFVKDSYTLELNNVIFDGNVAKYVGNDIYLAPKPSSMYYGDDYIYAINLNITFNDLNISQLSDNLIATINAPCDAQVGGAAVYFLLNDTQVGFAEIENSIAKLNYVFEDGQYNLSGYMVYPAHNSIINDGIVNVKLEGVLENGTFWVSNEGSDENGNGSQENPFKSIGYAVAEASKNCKNVFINIVEGIYTGDLNTDLRLSSMSNVTLVGAGIGKTIIDGENETVFARITQGQNKFSITNLTIQNMLPSNTEMIGNTINLIRSNLNALTAPIIIDEDATLCLDGVEITNCRGGEAIIVNSGNLIVDNSIFTNNGLSSKGLVFGGNVNINNSVLAYNAAVTGLLYKVPSLVINNSVIMNNFNLAYMILTGDVDAMMNNGAGIYTVIENTVIFNSGDNSSLSVIGYNETYKTLNPVLSLAGNVIANNISISNNYASPLPDGGLSYWDGGRAIAFGFAYGAYGKNVSVANSSFANLEAIWAVNTYGNVNFDFDNCVFYNVSKIAYSFTPGEGSQYNITNSVFVGGDSVIDRSGRSDRDDPNCNFNDNYWGSNDKPVVTFINPGRAPSFEPETWITLYSEDDETVIKNVTDGENSTAYLGNAPIRTDYADNKGALDYAVVFGPVGYLFTTDDEKNVIFDPEEAMYPFEAADPMDYRTPTAIFITGFEGDLIVVGELVDIVGNPIANATITSTFGDLAPVNTTTDANGTFKVKAGKNGILKVVYAGDDVYFDTEGNLTFTNAGKTAKTFISINTVAGDFAISGVLLDDEGTPIANAAISAVINGNTTVNTTTDANGAFTVQGESSCVADISFAGNDEFDPSNVTVTLKDLAPLREASVIVGNNLTQNAIDGKAGERGGFFKVQLFDASGKPLANKNVTFGFNGKAYVKQTNESGWAELQINLKQAGGYTFAVGFMGDDNYNATMQVFVITITKKPVTISAAAKTFKASAKTKKYTVTLTTEKGADGVAYFAAGKKVTLTVNGKTYTAKTDASGKATFSLKITKKGNFKATVKYAGDNTYKTASKSTKIKIN